MYVIFKDSNGVIDAVSVKQWEMTPNSHYLYVYFSEETEIGMEGLPCDALVLYKDKWKAKNIKRGTESVDIEILEMVPNIRKYLT